MTHAFSTGTTSFASFRRGLAVTHAQSTLGLLSIVHWFRCTEIICHNSIHEHFFPLDGVKLQNCKRISNSLLFFFLILFLLESLPNSGIPNRGRSSVSIMETALFEINLKNLFLIFCFVIYNQVVSPLMCFVICTSLQGQGI